MGSELVGGRAGGTLRPATAVTCGFALTAFSAPGYHP